jgi:hypothetical protein
MIPNVFVSSTIIDFHHLRDAIRDTINELGYNPVMSEYGDVGYLPSLSAEDSCYSTMQDCQLAIILIGKRYGDISANGLSVTHNEFRTARSKKIPVICLVDREVIAFKQIYDANTSNDNIPSFPGMDAPQKTFEFTNEFINSDVNNGFLEFGNVSEVRSHLKRQLAHLFGELLRSRFDPLKVEIQDVLSEIKTLRHELLKDTKSDYLPLLKSFRFMLDDKNGYFSSISECMFGSVDEAIPILIESKTFDDLIEKSGLELKITESILQLSHEDKDNRVRYHVEGIFSEFRDYFPRDDNILNFACTRDKKLLLNRIAKEYFDLKFEQFKQTITTKGKSGLQRK